MTSPFPPTLHKDSFILGMLAVTTVTGLGSQFHNSTNFGEQKRSALRRLYEYEFVAEMKIRVIRKQWAQPAHFL
jgi:hypothetical protein